MRDTYQREINYLRVSVTDRCNLRCVYCMPPGGVKSTPHEQVLRLEESYEVFKFYSAKYKSKKPTRKEDPHGIIARIIETTVRQPQTVKIDNYLEKYKTLEYIYDFGDYWRHKIELEKTIEDYEFGYPIILAGAGACPPEDVGGFGGYKEFLEAWNDLKHPFPFF
jgi:predicted metal-binding protein